MGFLDPKNQDDEDDALPGAAGLHLDLDLKRCPACHREVNPWQTRCPDCGEPAVAAAAEDDHDSDGDPHVGDAGDPPDGDADDPPDGDAGDHDQQHDDDAPGGR
jgi:hypothetical protein